LFCLRGKFGGVEDICGEKLKLVAAEFLDVLAPDACGRLREQLDGRAVGEAASLA